jgi:hypothetical protein
MSSSETAVPNSEPQTLIDDDQPIYSDCELCVENMSGREEVQGIKIPNKTKRHCIRCLKSFCPDHVSPISPIHCVECRPLIVHEEEYVRVDKHEDYNEIEDKLIISETKSHCKVITFEGLDSFYAEAIASKSIEELQGYVKAHQAIVRMMEDEILSKTIKKNTEMFRMAGTASAFVSNGVAKTKSRTPKAKKPIDINSLVNSIKGSLTAEQLQALKIALGGK